MTMKSLLRIRQAFCAYAHGTLLRPHRHDQLNAGRQEVPAVRILIVEDSPLVQKMYGLAFSQRQNTLVTCANGRDALDILSRCGKRSI